MRAKVDKRKTPPLQAARASPARFNLADGSRVNPAKRLLGELTKQARRTLTSADADAVHDLRVTIRRLAQARAVFKSAFPAKDRKKLRRTLREFTNLAGAVRDCDITMKLVAKSKWTNAALRFRLAGERQETQKALLKSLREWLDRRRTAPRSTGLRAVLEGEPRRVLVSKAKNFFARGARAANGAAPQELHKFRIATKKFRYTLELFASSYGPALNVWLKEIKGIQSHLGEINDYETARRMVARLISKGVVSKEFALNGGRKLEDELKKSQQDEVEEFHKSWTAQVARDWRRSLLPGLRDPKAGLPARA